LPYPCGPSPHAIASGASVQAFFVQVR
jgi:hypothetical protein